MLEAYRFGMHEGPHREPWAAAYHREAVLVYAESLPWSYQRDVARLFRDGGQVMATRSIRSDLAEDWAIVAKYMREACAAIEGWLASAGSASRQLDPSAAPELGGAVPRVVHYDALARLTTRDGARSLERAALAVQRHFDAEVPQSIEGSEQFMLTRLVSGMPIVEVAREMGYSERSMYREMSKLWAKLGVSSRAAGLHKATSEGLID